jgi:hypothetical protein
VTPETPYRFELFVRSLEPATASPAYEEAVETLAELAADEGVTFDLRVWGDRLPLGSACAQTEAVEALHARVRELRAWAAERDTELPGFERVRTDTLVGPAREALRLPPLLLAVYQDEALVAVAPRVERGTHHCVPGTLERLTGSPDDEAAVAPTVRS